MVRTIQAFILRTLQVTTPLENGETIQAVIRWTFEATTLENGETIQAVILWTLEATQNKRKIFPGGNGIGHGIEHDR